MNVGQTHKDARVGPATAGTPTCARVPPLRRAVAARLVGLDRTSLALPAPGAAREVVDAHVPRACWEESVPHAGSPGVERRAVRPPDLLDPLEPLDALPLGAARQPGLQAATRLAW